MNKHLKTRFEILDKIHAMESRQCVFAIELVGIVSKMLKDKGFKIE